MANKTIVLGIDEAGRGPVIGPMIIAGIEMDENKMHELISLGVKDSKMLSPSIRNKMYYQIKKLALNVHVMMISAEELDNKMMFMNLNKIELNGIAKIINKSNANKVYIDLPSTKKTYVQELKLKLRRDVKLVAEHKADVKYPIVSAASIIAKTIREREMDKIRKKYAGYGDIGSGYPADTRTMKFLREYYNKNKELPYEVRKSWATTKELIASGGKQTKLF